MASGRLEEQRAMASRTTEEHCRPGGRRPPVQLICVSTKPPTKFGVSVPQRSEASSGSKSSSRSFG